ncbi:MAG: hypothetical protein LUE96_10670 [Lachnospiraceae bacterium]|nr:hypothetical protein [Lachnospiraceae bacterium]
MQPCRFKAYDVSSCTADIPGSYDCAEMQKENQHGEDRVPLNAVFSDIFSVPKEESAFAFDVVQSFYRKPDGLVRNYIHRSDGKKRA